MPKFYSGGTRPTPAAPAFSSQTGASGGGFAAPEASEDAGKTAFDFSDPLGSIVGGIGGVGEFVGGALGGIGEIGIEGGPKIKNLGFEAAGSVVGAAGGIAGDAISAIGAGPVGAIVGGALSALGAPGRLIESETAKNRLKSALLFGSERNANEYGVAYDPSKREGIAPDILARLDQGESVDKLAEELVTRGQGYSENLTAQLGIMIATDPLNVLSIGIGGAARAERAARLLGTTDELNAAVRIAGRGYNAIGEGLSAGRAGIARSVLGRSTSGVIHAIGVGDYKAMHSGAGAVSANVAKELDDLLSSGNLQMARATMGDELQMDASIMLKGLPEGTLPTPENIGRTIQTKLSATDAIKGNRIERNIEEKFARVAPMVSMENAPAVLAATLRVSVDDATRILGKMTEGKLKAVRLAAYARAGENLEAAKAAVGASKKIDVGRLTPIAEDTLTVDRAKALLGELDAIGPGAAISRFRTLEDRFLGKPNLTVDNVREFIDDMIRRDALPQEVHLPTSGKNALPGALGAWRQESKALGYDLGFAPKSGWSTIVDDAGNVIVTDPFIHFQSGARAISARNPIGQMADSLMRGISQRTIINDSRARMVKIAAEKGAPLAAAEARAIHRVILRMAGENGVTPRGLIGVTRIVNGRKGNAIHAAFEEVLGVSRLAELEKVADPVYLTMAAFRGNLSHVGLTQAFTGSVKAGATERVPVAQITEYLYPKARFEWNPLFQAQERIESDFWNALRGVRNTVVDPEMQETYKAFSNLPELRYLDMEYSGLYLWGDVAAQKVVGSGGKFGRFLDKFGNVAARKQSARLQQVFFEHGEYFQQAVTDINPRLWRTMVDEYGTTDPRAIAEAFIKERLALARGEVDDVIGHSIQQAYDAGDIAAGQALNRTAGVARGGTRASGGAVKASEADIETVYTAWRESFRQSSLQAYKTHFFNPERGWLERTLNHPYLGFYPLSYMYGKVLPEFARFLLKRPFGLDAPLAGANAVQRVQQSLLAARVTDPEFDTFLNDHKDAIYLIEVLLPGTPTNIPVNAPAWARHIVEDSAAGRDITGDTVVREVSDSARYALGASRTLDVFGKGLVGKRGAVDMVTDIFSNLTKSAEQYDQFVGSSPGVLPAR